MSIGIVKEAYSVWERRCCFTPRQVERIVRTLGIEVVVQPSGKRVFADAEYVRAGATLSDDLSGCNAIFGVKQVPQANLIPDKTYLFFSHTIKGQPENEALLASVLEKRVRLIDYEVISQNGVAGAPRLVAFGEYAGKAGMIDTLRGLGQQLLYQGLSTPFLSIGSAYMYPSYKEATRAVRMAGDAFAAQHRQQSTPSRFQPLVFLFTGSGNVNKGARQVFNLLPHAMIEPSELMQRGAADDFAGLPSVVGCQAGIQDMVARIDGEPTPTFDKRHYYAQPEHYHSVFFEHLARHCNVLVNGVYWDSRFPRVVSKSDIAKFPDHRMHFIADISCDVRGGVELLERANTVEEPFGPCEANDKISIMGVDILPSELPREASQHFGDYLLPFVPQLAHNTATSDLAKELQGACIADKGSLRERFTYIGDLYRELGRPGHAVHSGGKATEDTAAQIAGSTVLRMHGHLFDSGLINRMLDVVEAQLPHGRFQIVECMVGANRKSTVLLQVTMDGGRPQLDQVLTKIFQLAADPAFASSEATVKELPHSFCDGNFAATLRDTYREVSEEEDGEEEEDGGEESGLLTGPPRGSRHLVRKDSASFLDQADVSVTSLIAPSLQKVAVLGAGMVAKPCVEYLSRDSSRHVSVVSGDFNEAKALCRRVGRTNIEPVHIDALQHHDELESLVRGCDAVVSLLPATMHASVAKMCVAAKVPLVTASYVSPELQALSEAATEAGVPILCEMGLDPGMDHMSAMAVIDQIHESGGKVHSFTSVCGGLTAPEAANNPFGYKFSWSPRGVLTAMQNSARFSRNGELVEIESKDLLASAEPFRMYNLPSLALEQLPNRDALKYVDKYRIPEAQTCFRGTLRYEGFSAKMLEFVRAGFLREDLTFGEALGAFQAQATQEAKVAMEFLLAGSHDAELDGRPAVDQLCDLLQTRLALREGERDMTVMQHNFNGDEHVSTLLAYGTKSDTAMASTVGLTVAIGADLLLDPTTAVSQSSGVLLPTSKMIYQPGLKRLAAEGIIFTNHSR
ncbi:Alpha-aminoadipic semialdehyde synthase (cAt-LKR/SDH) (LKR/SDH) [Includes: Lysine ketoglutarate reductase (LKR) [Durusdinium trenchii]|uniref:Alpha-aminoadipic semialdehyde synthase (CAt-LKR/SDH) (LKR/SDH) n=1 Tax=Durusdinium trenchii TaxID=1381693 RepID=A0ABP0JG99_9DINO